MIKWLSNVVAVAVLVGVSCLAAPAFAMHWAIYAPDDGQRYWIDTDSIQQRGDYIYFTWLALDQNSPAPTTTAGNQSAIKCATGDSLKLDSSGAWVAGPHFTDAAFLFKFVCKG